MLALNALGNGIVILMGLTLLKDWSRVYLGEQTMGQVLLGWGIAVVCVGVMLGQLWLVGYL